MVGGSGNLVVWHVTLLSCLSVCLCVCVQLARLHTLQCHGLFQHLSSWRMTHQAPLCTEELKARCFPANAFILRNLKMPLMC